MFRAATVRERFPRSPVIFDRPLSQVAALFGRAHRMTCDGALDVSLHTLTTPLHALNRKGDYAARAMQRVSGSYIVEPL